MSRDYDPQSFDHLAEEFDFLVSRERDHAFFLENLPGGRGRALDVGCGSGRLAGALAESFDAVVGVDISEPMLALARRKQSAANLEFLRMDARELRLEGPFDLITSHTTFHHIEDVGAVLTRLKQLLAPGGRLLLVDNVSKRPALRRWVLIVGPWADLPVKCARHGVRDALRMFRFRRSRPWLDHLTTDRFLDTEGFRRVYGTVLPGASFTPLGYFMGVGWDACSSSESFTGA